MADSVNLVYAFTAGVIAFFSPCALPLLPSYITYYLGLDTDKKESNVKTKNSLLKGFVGGVLCALGAILTLLLIGAGISSLGEAFSPYMGMFEPAVGIILIILGVFILLGKGFSFGIKTNIRGRGYTSLLGYGALYSLAASGCVAPLFVGVILEALTKNFWQGFALFIAYAIGMAILLIIITVLVATAKSALVNRMRGAVKYTKPLAGTVAIVAGVFLLAQFIWLFVM
jgi:cytochrome c-type biogenesis protein